jgi:hypothetical protein
MFFPIFGFTFGFRLDNTFMSQDIGSTSIVVAEIDISG